MIAMKMILLISTILLTSGLLHAQKIQASNYSTTGWSAFPFGADKPASTYGSGLTETKFTANWFPSTVQLPII